MVFFGSQMVLVCYSIPSFLLSIDIILGTLFGAAGSLGITYINNARGIASWRWLYIIYGSLAALIGILAFLFLADSPNAKILKLTDEEKVIIEDRTRDNAVVRVKKIKMHHVWEAVREPRLWLLAFSTLCNNLHTGGLVVFSTLIVRNLGFTVSTCLFFFEATFLFH
jgi:sugar phosphate permease